MAPQYGEVRVDYITYTTGVSPNEANVTVPVSGLINDPTFSGNVIIEGDLTVSGSINASGVIISGITGLFDDGTEAAPSIAFASDPDTGIYKPATNEIGISTNASEALRIDNNGNVGIGTETPTSKVVIRQDQVGYSNLDFYNETVGGGITFRQIHRKLDNTGSTSVDLAWLTSGGFAINNNDTNSANFTTFKVGTTEVMRFDLCSGTMQS